MTKHLTTDKAHLEVRSVTPLSLSLDILDCLDELNDQEAWLVDLDLDDDDEDIDENVLEDDDDDAEHSTGKMISPRVAVPQWVSALKPAVVDGKQKTTTNDNNNNNNNNHSDTKSQTEEEKKLELPTILETIQSIDLVETRKKLAGSVSEVVNTQTSLSLSKDPNAHLFQDLDVTRGPSKTQVEFSAARQEVLKLPQLSGWVTKKSGGKMGQWQKRWLVIKPTHMLWSKKVEEIVNPLDVKERRKFQNCVPLLQVNQVSKVNSTHGRKFNVSTIARVYGFRASSKEERDQWVDGINAHLQALQSTVAFIVGNGLHFKDKQ